MPPLEAAFAAPAQIGFTIVSLTVSLIAVFIPLLFMTGVIGRLFSEFAVTLTVSVVVSAVVSLTLTPMMCGRLLRPIEREHPGRLARTFEPGSRGCSAATAARCAGRCGTRALVLLVARPRWPGPCCSISSCPRASCRSRIPAWSPP